MASLTKLLSHIFVFLGALDACGGTTVTSGGNGGAAGTGGGTSGTTVTCDVVGATVVHMGIDPTAVACVTTNCKENLPLCLGANYTQGDFGTSFCASYAACVNTCSCASPCTNGCTVPTNCTSCLTDHLAACAFTHCT